MSSPSEVNRLKSIEKRYFFNDYVTKERTKRPFHVVVLGNIGSGKSNLTEKLTKRIASTEQYSSYLIKEPVEDWEKSKILDQLYRDKAKTGFGFQLVALASRISKYMNYFRDKGEEGTDVIISDGHIIGDREFFVEALCEEGSMTKPERDAYDIAFDQFKEMIKCPDVDLIIFLDCKAETCKERIRARNRPSEVRNGEVLVPVEYLNQLGMRIQNFYTKLTTNHIAGDKYHPLFSGAEVLKICAEGDKNSVTSDVYNVIMSRMHNRVQK